jgi:hypothetical protein
MRTRPPAAALRGNPVGMADRQRREPYRRVRLVGALVPGAVAGLQSITRLNASRAIG